MKRLGQTKVFDKPRRTRGAKILAMAKRKTIAKFSLFTSAALGLTLCFSSLTPSLALSPDCERLRRTIADAPRGGQGAQYQAAADRQRAEIDRTLAYSQQIGCENRKFLFFGSDPPVQCGQIRAQIGRMRANLEDLQTRAGGSQAGRPELIARFEAQCANQQTKSPSIVDALLGQPKPGELEEQPLSPDDETVKPLEKPASPSGEARAGGKAVCVRSCDGAFFPLSYSASGGQLDSLADMCRALCPNAEVTLYTYPVSGDVEQAVSINGARYMDSPTALRYRHVFDPSCSCRRKGQTWASALAPAESLLGKQDNSDIVVTPEKAAELSRPKPDVKTKGSKPAKGAATSSTPIASPVATPSLDDGGKTDANGVDTTLRDAAAAISHDGSGIGDSGGGLASIPVGEDRGKVFDEVGVDGVKRTVRVVGK